mmetsp:Transcript_24838/g.69091  ORF Transcript_24838/g.69091 Transcript_24838/m.69091 type:complete len:248 (-) Transcript_24838:1300-2043(-)|eukprot:CAMPEP_0198114252 /NCGR_PEP_ID=MMETSP1442-20131203/5688_1 /TAXON_ID= /ORGANISM="Craspedostauros australis, Strain CCMP3328" /LENGTH=247 /DNA_ID=CAMNT_0043771525 /DNA_START=148 /DNA_END=891 /DNA_ORIENTATION=-
METYQSSYERPGDKMNMGSSEKQASMDLHQPLIEADSIAMIPALAPTTSTSTMMSTMMSKPTSAPFPSRSAMMLAGIFSGLVVQIISLGSYGLLMVDASSPMLGSAATAVLQFLTKVDFYIYISIWGAFTFTMTTTGMNTVQSCVGAAMPLTRRTVFVGGVFFLIGIVGGAFLAWMAMDAYLGDPIPYTPLFATVMVDLLLCYLMIVCYDYGNSGMDSTDEEEHEEEAGVTEQGSSCVDGKGCQECC